ncbi:hypothetical protein F7734_40460 [Scytonema sp. UIC 10036]|nr:hypothetical protein [Scytonema sp. UIC 10036]
MQSFNLDRTITAWSSIAENVFVPHTEEEYERLVEMLDRLMVMALIDQWIEPILPRRNFQGVVFLYTDLTQFGEGIS